MTVRTSAAHRRLDVLRAAMLEFGQAAYEHVAVSTIAERAGVSQPYVFRLFGTKKDLFLATLDQRTRDILAALRQSVASASPETSPSAAITAACTALVTDDPLALRSLVYAWAAASDDEIGAAARSSYVSVWGFVASQPGMDDSAARNVMANLTMLSALDALGMTGLTTARLAPPKPADDHQA